MYRQNDEPLLPRTFNGMRRAARQKASKMKIVVNDVFTQRHQEMMLVKDMENAHPDDPEAFPPKAGTNIHPPTPAPLSKEARRLLAEKGLSPDPTAQKPRGQKSMGPPPGHVTHISPPKEDKK